MNKPQATPQEFSVGSDSYTIPADRQYDREHHMWVQVDAAQGKMRVGMDTLGLAALGDLAYVTLKPVGTALQRGESFGTLEAAKMTGDLIAPVSGMIMTRNEETVRNPALVNQSPYMAGWLVLIEPSSWESESAQLVGDEDLPAWVEAELKRYREQGWID